MKLYRYQVYGGSITLEEFFVSKETPCGYWIDEMGVPRWVSKTSRKRFAYPTEEQAAESFRIRKKRHIERLKHELRKAELVQAAFLKAPKAQSVNYDSLYVGLRFSEEY